MMEHETPLKIFLILIAIFGVWRLTKRQVQADHKNTFIVGTSAQNPPFSFLENDHIVGFDIDVAKEVAQRLGKNLQIRNFPLAALIPEIMTDTIHAITGHPSVDKLTSVALLTEPEPLVMAISKKYPALYEQVQKELQALAEDGTLQNLQKKWKLAP